MTELETDKVLSAIRRGEDSLPKLRTATGLEYAQLHPVLHKLEYEWKSIDSYETAQGFQRFKVKGTEALSETPMGHINADHGTPNNGHKSPVEPHPAQGPTYKALDLAEVEEIMATEETIAKGAAKLGLTNMQLYTRRQRDEAVESAVRRGRNRFYEAENNETVTPNDETETPLSDTITLVSEPDDPVSDTPQTEQPQVLPENPQESQQVITEIITENGTSGGSETEQQERAQQVKSDISEDKIEVSNPANKVTKRYGPFCQANCFTDDDLDLGHHKDCAYWKEAEARRIATAQNVEDKIEVAKERDIIPELSGQDTQMVTRQPDAATGLSVQGKYQFKYEGLTVYCDFPEEVIEVAERLQGRFVEPRPPVPTTIKRAWSKDFEDQSEEGIPALTMLYLVSMLHEGMEEHEKQAVWTLILYLKRVEAAAEAARVAKKGSQE